MNYCDYDTLKHYQPGEFCSKYKTILKGNVAETDKEILSEKMTKSFKNGEYSTYITTSDLIFYRMYGKFNRSDGNPYDNGAGKIGRYVSTEFAESLIDAKIRLALDPAWLSTRMYEEKILLPKGSIINVGLVEFVKIKSGTILEGGADQVVLQPNWSKDYIIGYRVVTKHQLINPPNFSTVEPLEIVDKKDLYKIPACPYCGGSDVEILDEQNRIHITGSKGGLYTLRYKCKNSECNYHW